MGEIRRDIWEMPTLIHLFASTLSRVMWIFEEYYNTHLCFYKLWQNAWKLMVHHFTFVLNKWTKHEIFKSFHEELYEHGKITGSHIFLINMSHPQVLEAQAVLPQRSKLFLYFRKTQNYTWIFWIIDLGLFFIILLSH